MTFHIADNDFAWTVQLVNQEAAHAIPTTYCIIAQVNEQNENLDALTLR